MRIFSVIVIIFTAIFLKFAPVNLNEVKAAAPKTWEQAGYKIVGYEGFQWGHWFWGNYGGAEVWYSLKRHPKDNGIIYTGSIKRWGDEFHIYGPRAVDAIKP